MTPTEKAIDEAFAASTDAASRAAAIEKLGPVLANIESPVERDILVQRVAMRFGIRDVAVVRTALRRGVERASANHFKPGDVVRLRSGSPQLTIEGPAADAEGKGPRWKVMWFNAGELLRTEIPECALAVDFGKARGEP